MASGRNRLWDSTFSRMAGLLSAGAALVSILSFVATRGDGPEPAAAAGLAASKVGRVALAPAADTATSIGDSLQFTSSAADAHGQAVRAAVVHWSVDDPAVASVDSTGMVVARSAGRTGVTVTIGGHAARAVVVVAPRPMSLGIAGDSVLRLGEGAVEVLRATARDARHHEVAVGELHWSSSDVSVASVDSTGRLHALVPGAAVITANAGVLVAERSVVVLPVPASITLLAGADQRAPAGESVPDSVAVQVVSRGGRPVPGVAVRFLPAKGAGAAVPDTVRTDDKGVAAVQWTLGLVPGRQRMAVRVSGVDSALVLRAEADPLPGNTRIELVGSPPEGEVGQPLAGPVVLRVSDTAGVALADVPVTWTVLDDGLLSQAEARTDSLGEVSAHWALGPTAGVQRLRVHVGNPRSMPPYAVTARALAGPAVAVELASGNAQRGTPGTRLSKAIVFRAVDSLGNSVGGAEVWLWSSSGTVDSILQTAPDGKVTLRWTLGTRAGPARLVARLAGDVDSAVASAVVQPGVAATLAFLSPPGSATAGKTLSKPVQVVLRDQHGNPVSGVEVAFAVATGKVAPAKAVTDAEGRAATKWTLGAAAGRQVLSAAVQRPVLRASYAIEAKGTRPPPPPDSTGTPKGPFRRRAT